MDTSSFFSSELNSRAGRVLLSWLAANLGVEQLNSKPCVALETRVLYSNGKDYGGVYNLK